LSFEGRGGKREGREEKEGEEKKEGKRGEEKSREEQGKRGRRGQRFINSVINIILFFFKKRIEFKKKSC